METHGKRLRLFYSDVQGLERSKWLYGDWGGGKAAFCITVYPLTLDREILPIPGFQFDIGLPDVEAHLDEASLRPGWDEGAVVGIADMEFRGQPCDLDPREILRRAIEPWEERGLSPQLAFEFEFFLMEPDDEGGWRSIRTPGHRVYGTGPSVDPYGVVDEIVRTALASGFYVESWGSEYDMAQYEVNIRYKDAIQATDEAFLFRLLAREVAARRGLLATFIGRPFMDRGGSGLHVNMSFRREDGSNAFHDPASQDGLSELARRCMAGMLSHHVGMASIHAPHVNAYRRLRPDMLNGYWANWGFDDRTVAIRIPPGRGETSRLEHRTADGAANPYLSAAAILHTARFGIELELEPPPPQTPGEPPNTDICIPASLDEALQRFEEDKELCEALGSDLVTAHTILKRAEWERYVAAVPDPGTEDVTDWELSYYLPFF